MIVESPQKSQVVYKFGGTSIGSAAGFLRIREIIYNHHPQVVVVSALAQVTDLLEEFCSTKSLYERRSCIQAIINKHEAIIRELKLRVSIQDKIQKLFFYIKERDFSDAVKADILSVGEDLSAYLLQQFCHSKDFPVSCLEARDVIITDNQYMRAVPLFQEMKTRWKTREISKHVCYVMQGFVGATSQKETTILGRGGSDYSAAMLGELLSAQEVRIYTDVSGVYTEDPKKFPKAQHLVCVSFEEMYQRATEGAKVIYPLMLDPCKRAEIPIFVTSTFDLEEKGTWIFSSPRSSFLHCVS